jgi:uracil-DNA glycosylase family 4
MFEDLNLTFPLIVKGGLLEEASKSILKDEPGNTDKYLDMLINSSISLPLTFNNYATWMRCVPGHTVAGPYGMTPSEVMLVGRQPNWEELEDRRLFSKLAGQVWKTPLDELGVDYNDWYLTNACWFHVPESVRFNRSHVKEWAGLLQATYKKVNPKYVLLFGAEAVKAFWALKDPKAAQKMKLKDVRGAVLDFNEHTKVMATYHPSNVLIDPSITFEFRRDMRAFSNLTQGKAAVTVRPKDTIHYIDNIEQLEYLVDEVVDQGHLRFAVDVETGGGNWREGQLRTIQFAWGKNQAAVVILRREGMTANFSPSIFSALAPLIRLFKRHGVTVVGHNLRFDLKWLTQYGLDLTEEFINGGSDTMLLHHLLYETADQQLELVGVKLLGFPRYDLPLREWLDKNGVGKKLIKKMGYSMIPDELLHPYGAMDVILCLEVDTELHKIAARHPEVMSLYYNLVHPVNTPILEMETGGVCIDMERLKNLIDLFVAKQDELKIALCEMIKWPDFNPRSPADVKEILFGWMKEDKEGKLIRKSPEEALILDLQPVKATDNTPWEKVMNEQDWENKYNPSTDAESLGILAADHPFAKALKQFKVIDQIVKNFLRPGEEDEEGDYQWTGGLGAVIDDDNRIRTSFRQTLETGRFATSPNLQNIPKKQEKELAAAFKKDGVLDPRYAPIRSIFVASPGTVFVEADWNQAELFTLAAIAKDMRMMEVLQTSDLHTVMMQQMFSSKEYNGRTLGDYTVDELNQFRKTDKTLDALRIAAKSVNFGIPYGRGAGAIVREVKREGIIVTQAEAQGWIETFHNTFQRVSEYLNDTKRKVINPRRIVNPWGRHRRFPITRDDKLINQWQREAVNFPIQSTVGDAMSQALINLWNYRTFIDPGVQYRILLSIHDAVLLEVPVAHVAKVIEEVIPLCMKDGLEVPGLGLHYGLGDIEVQLRWGEHADPDELLAMGLPHEYCGYKKK